LVKYGNGILIGVLSILVLVVFVSGCTDSINTELGKTFSKEGISFKYPVDWSEMPYENKGPKNDFKIIGLIGPLNLEYDVTIQKAVGLNIKEIKNNTMEFNKLNYNATIISENTTTINGVTVYQVLYTLKDPEASDDEMKNLLCLIEKGKSVYILEFRAYSSANFDKYSKISNEILSTVQIA